MPEVINFGVGTLNRCYWLSKTSFKLCSIPQQSDNCSLRSEIMDFSGGGVGMRNCESCTLTESPKFWSSNKTNWISHRRKAKCLAHATGTSILIERNYTNIS